MNEAAGNLFLNFAADCAAAWLAHQFGPHLPRFSLFRKYFSWIPVVILTVPGQFLIYESYVIRRPWYAYGLIYLFPMVAGACYVLLEVSAIKYESQIQKGELLLKYPRLRKLAVPLLVALPVAYVTFIGVWLYEHYQPPEKNIIIVARFSGPQPEIYSPTPELLRALHKLSESAGDIEILPAHAEITPEDGPSAADRLGRAWVGTRNNASVVLWGWYAVIEGHASITGNLEFRKGISLPSYAKPQPSLTGEGYDLREIRYQVPLEKLNFFKLQADVADEMRARCSYIVALALLSARQYQRAKQLLDAANLGPDQDLQHTAVDPAIKAQLYYDHLRNGPAVDYLESVSGKNESSRISGKWRVLVTRAYTEIALGLDDQALLDCAEAALLSKEPVTYYCLGQVHLKRAEKAKDFTNAIVEATRANEDCSVAVQHDLKFSDALGCRADADLLVASNLQRRSEVTTISDVTLPVVPPLGAASFESADEYFTRKSVEANEQSLRSWNEYIKSNPSDYYGFVHRGEAYRGLGENTAAEADYSRALTLNPRAVVAYNNRGALRLQKAVTAANTKPPEVSASPFEQTLWKQALTDLQSAVTLRPREPSAWCNLGEVAWRLEKHQLAKDAFQRCQSLAADDSMRSWADGGLHVLEKGAFSSKRTRVDGSVQARALLHKVLPEYPKDAKAARVEGTVVLHAIIGKDGTVQELEYVSGPALLKQPAMDAVRQWRYEPTLSNGVPVEVDTSIQVAFELFKP